MDTLDGFGDETNAPVAAPSTALERCDRVPARRSVAMSPSEDSGR